MSLPKEVGGRFVVGDEIVKRASCQVHKATDKTLGDKVVAIKFFVDRPNDRTDWIEAFDRQLNQLRAASHKSLVPIIAGGFDQGVFYITMELIEGPNLRDMMKGREGPLDLDFAIDTAVQVAGGLQEIHEQNTYHGHLDTRAILFKGGNQVRLAGYYPAVIEAILKTITSGGRLLSDPHYISPEQISDGEGVDGRADIFALSAILYEMVTGQKPFVADNPLQLAMARLTKTATPPSKLNPNISPLVDAAIVKGLSRDKKNRFASMTEFIDAVTGGKKPVMNPLAEALAGESEAERLNTSTIAVSMSTEAIRHILQAHESTKTKSAPEPVPAASDVTGTQRRAAVTDTPNVPLDASATVTGVTTDSLLKGSFVGIDSALRGKKFLLERSQAMIGSDPGCEICVAGKGIPARYAIVVQRGKECFVGALSPAGISINGKHISGSDETPLKRGDVINIGPHQLRFVAPGEVFTLKDDVADRAIDRPPSRLPKILALVSAAVVVIGMMVFWSYQQNRQAQQIAVKKKSAQKEQDRKKTIEQLRREGDEFFRNGQLIEPDTRNARNRFEQLRDLDPNDPYAKRRLDEIAERVAAIQQQEQRKRQFADQVARLNADGDRYFQSGNYVSPPGANARDAYQEALKLDPQNAQATKQLAEITRILGDFVGKVSDMLVRAKELRDQGFYISPEGGNAYEVVQQIFGLDPANAEAKALLIDMAARSVIRGDAAKAGGSAQKAVEAEEAYLTARAIGMDPDYIKEKMVGLDIMKKSSGGRVAVIRGESKPKDKKKDPRFLDTDLVEQRIAAIQRQKGVLGQQGQGRFIDEQAIGK